jgi:hypothetical protein
LGPTPVRRSEPRQRATGSAGVDDVYLGCPNGSARARTGFGSGQHRPGHVVRLQQRAVRSHPVSLK